MSAPKGPVRDTEAMIAGMSPELDPVIYHFCTFADAAAAEAARGSAIASFTEAEGTSLILPDEAARRHGVTSDLPMLRITLNVYSALDGVGLTAAVAGVLAAQGIPCNMVAAYHHDHAFVPAAEAPRAMQILTELAGR